jgi:hypothetical protein
LLCTVEHMTFSIGEVPSSSSTASSVLLFPVDSSL